MQNLSAEKLSSSPSITSPTQSSNPQISEIVELNVGGQIFSTFRSTLVSSLNPESLLSAMFSGRFPLVRDSHGRIFIDRDPQIFSLVLNYLRSGNIHWFDSFENRRVLAAELEYFGIEVEDQQKRAHAFSLITFDKLLCYGVKIVNNHTIECTQSSDWLSSNYWQIPTYPPASTRDCFAASTEEFSHGIYKFLFLVESRFKCLRVGLITKNRPLVNDPPSTFPTFCLQANPDRNFVQLCGSRYAGPYDYAEYKVNEGDYIVMTVDLEEGTLSYQINNNDLGVAFRHLPHEDYLIFVSSTGSSTSVSSLADYPINN